MAFFDGGNGVYEIQGNDGPYQEHHRRHQHEQRRSREYHDALPRSRDPYDDRPGSREYYDDRPRSRSHHHDGRPTSREYYDNLPRPREYYDDRPRSRSHHDGRPTSREYYDDRLRSGHHHHHYQEYDERSQSRDFERPESRGNYDSPVQQQGYYPPPGIPPSYRPPQGPPPSYRTPPGPPPGWMPPQQGPPPGWNQQQPRPPPGYGQGPPPPQQYYNQGGPPRMHKKSLLIGINYVGTKHQLQGCHQDVANMRQFLGANGYPNDQNSQVVLRDDQYTDPRGPFWPNGHNMIAAMQWLIREPNTTCFLHYSGHGGQVPDEDGNRVSGFNDTVVPYDFERNGQIPSGYLHRTLVTRLPPNSTLFIIFDCCHSGSAVELPYVYRSDEDGNVSMMDNINQGIHLVGAASHLMQGGFSMGDMGEAKQLLAGAQSFFKGLQHRDDDTADEPGLSQQEFAQEYESEGRRNVWMYSGCRDDQTSADAAISGSHVGAMSWAFLECMRKYGPRQSYVDVLQNTRHLLQGRYTQVPQLSVGFEQDLDQPIHI